jgi:ABC-type multidrug transport system ATPase subunit
MRFGRVTALESITFRVQPGEAIGLVGHNGAGKSTLFRILAGLLPPTSGSVTLAGHPPDSREAGKLRGYLPDFGGLPVWPTPIELLRFYGEAGGLGPAAISEAVAWALEMVGLPEHYWHRPVGEGSKGVRQRLGLATAIVHRPRLVLLDEPSGALDPEGHFAVQQLVRELKAQGVALLIASHILSDLAAVADRVLLLQSGRLALDIPWADLESMGEAVGGVEALVATQYGWRAKHA